MSFMVDSWEAFMVDSWEGFILTKQRVKPLNRKDKKMTAQNKKLQKLTIFK